VVKGRPSTVAVSQRTLSAEEIGVLPGARGDALASLESMPGVGHAPPLSGLLILRGSGPNDTNVFVDGTTINLPYHFGGLSAVVPSEVLERLDFYPGNYGGQYGRGMGGVVEFGIRAPRDDGRFHGLAQIDPIEGRLLVEGPVGGGWRFLAAARRSTIDLWLDPLLSGSGTPTFAPRYYDGQFELQKDFDSRRSLRLLVFGYDDQLDLFQNTSESVAINGSIAAHIGFAAVQARYVDRYAPSGELRVMASVGRDVARRAAGTLFYEVDQTPVTVRADLSQRLFAGAKLEAGLDLVESFYAGSARAPALADPDVPSGGPSVMPIQVTASGSRFEPGAYAQGILTPWWGLRVVPTVRADYDDATGAWDVAPRLVAKQDLPLSSSRRTTLKAGAGEFFQPPQLVEVVPVFGQTQLASSRSIQYEAGVEQELSPQIDLSLDVFDKQMDRLVVPGAHNSGEGRAYGAEWLLRYKPDAHFYGWIAYTLSRSERRDSPSQPFYAFDYDQTHNLAVVGSWRIDDHWRVGARFRFTSGNPYTPSGPGALDAGSGTYLPTPTLTPNGARLPPFHELDLRVDRTWTLGAARLTAYADIENVYSYAAPIDVAYSFDFTHSQFAQGLPILPSIGLRGEL
jgi:hypothetical protein